MRSEEHHHHAKLALIVADAYQGRGIGTILMQKLASAAKQAGITIFEGVVLESNEAMLHLLRKMGGQKLNSEDGAVTIELPVSNILEGEIA